MPAIEVQITYPRDAEARQAASRLVEARFAACGQVTQIASVYRWEDRIETEGEFLLTLKTLDTRLPDIERHVRENHPYDVPQITALPIAGGAQDYLDWIADEVET